MSSCPAHRASRIAFLIAGVTVTKLAVPYLAADPPTNSETKPKVPTECGLHGYTCSGNCDPNANENHGALGDPRNPRSAWQACCQLDNGQWTCCNYADYCGTRGLNWGTNCEGVTPSGSKWCSGDTGRYICTEITCTGGYNSSTECQVGCTGKFPCGT